MTDKVAVVTGANKGIGLAITKALVAEAAYVIAFFRPDAATVDYGAAKAAVVNLSKSRSQEFGPKGIRVNCVSPGQVSTDLWLGEHAFPREERGGVLCEHCAGGQLAGQPLDVALHQAPLSKEGWAACGSGI